MIALTDILQRLCEQEFPRMTVNGASERALSVFLQSLRLDRCSHVVREHGASVVIGSIAYSVVAQFKRPAFSAAEISAERLIEHGYLAPIRNGTGPVCRSLLLLRALISGAIAVDATPRTVAEIATDAGEGMSQDARACLREELERPLTVAQLAEQSHSLATATEIYLAAAMAVRAVPNGRADDSVQFMVQLTDFLALEAPLARRLNDAATQVAALPEALSQSA